jgi:hypothetical protein
MNIEKIEINGHYVWVDKDAEIKEGDYVYVNCSEIKVTEICQVSGYYNEQFLFKHNSQIHMDYCKKIIAASPELKLEGVPTYVEWLAEENMKQYDWVEDIDGRGCFIKGYQTAEKELPTWDDVRKAIELARLIKEDGSVEDSFTAEDISGCTEVCTYGWSFKHSEKEIIEQLKQSKL